MNFSMQQTMRQSAQQAPVAFSSPSAMLGERLAKKNLARQSRSQQMRARLTAKAADTKEAKEAEDMKKVSA